MKGDRVFSAGLFTLYNHCCAVCRKEHRNKTQFFDSTKIHKERINLRYVTLLAFFLMNNYLLFHPNCSSWDIRHRTVSATGLRKFNFQICKLGVATNKYSAWYTNGTVFFPKTAFSLRCIVCSCSWKTNSKHKEKIRNITCDWMWHTAHEWKIHTKLLYGS